MDEVTARLAVFDVDWRDVTAIQVYTIRDLQPFLVDEIVKRGTARPGF